MLCSWPTAYRVLSPSFRKFITVFRKFLEQFYTKFPTTTNLPYNSAFAYKDTSKVFTVSVDYHSVYLIIICAHACFH